jgi:ABC-type amino acid transport system permease subunit
MIGHREMLREIAGTAELFASLHDGSVVLLIIAIHAAFIGGIISILTRIQDFLSDPTLSPPLIYISVIRKPFLAATFVVLVFAVLKAGLISFHGVDLAGPSAPYLAWALGFLCGFSERLAQDFAVSASDRFGEAGPVDVKSSRERPRTTN